MKTIQFRARSRAILFLVAVTAAVLISPVRATTSDEQAVLAPITAMFAGMTKHDVAAIKKPLLPGGSMVLMRQGKPHQMTFDAFAELVGRPGKGHVEERIHDPLVRTDNDLAVVWAPFEVLVDGKVDSCGTDLFNLVRIDGKWLIAGIADTGRKDCAVK
ncbi:MAG TPA: nuclear transport factor 2 family protein [Candidatus Angelobacter sp.]|nr:nuclear transport factor 2 family protein [Candidatus Angelobacter sp.]